MRGVMNGECGYGKSMEMQAVDGGRDGDDMKGGIFQERKKVRCTRPMKQEHSVDVLLSPRRTPIPQLSRSRIRAHALPGCS